MKQANIILFVNIVPKEAIDSIRRWGRKNNTKYRIAVILDPAKEISEENKKIIDTAVDLLISVDFNQPLKIAKAILPYEDELLAITCRGDVNIEDFTKIIAHVPYLRASSTESLLWSIDKIMMRRRFRAYDPAITPEFMVVSDTKPETIEKIKTKIGFPLILKPAGLGASLLVSISFHRDEFVKMLQKMFKQIKKVYEENERKGEPEILVEQFMEGDMYSIDGYVNSRGKIYFCPMVHIKTGRTIGFDDFFGYQQMTPTLLSKKSVQEAERIGTKAVHALGVRSSTVHIELMKMETGWKVIELGPRIGGFRHQLYQLSYGIDHSLNDIFIHIPKRPVIPKRIKGYSAALKIFAKEEGVLKKLQGIQRIQKLPSIKDVKVNKKVGDKLLFAKHGGRSVANIILFNKSRSDLLADIRKIEQMLVIETE